jgi:hypothetical protein
MASLIMPNALEVALAVVVVMYGLVVFGELRRTFRPRAYLTAKVD